MSEENQVTTDVHSVAVADPVAISKNDGTGDATLPPTTTTEDDKVTAGQRRINMIWELTQSFIAIFVVVASIIVASIQAVYMDNAQFPAILSNSLFLILGFYYSRTNHSNVGGVGKKPVEDYKGR